MQIFKGFILFLSVSIIFGSGFFYLWRMDVGLYVAFIVLLGLLYRHRALMKSLAAKLRETIRETTQNFKFVNYIVPAVFTGSVILIFYYLLSHRTDLPIRSPWEVVSWKLFVLYGIAAASLFVSLISEIPKWLKTVFIFSFTFLSFGTALILYKIGYGFDPFIHRATEEYIAEFGTITPKPFYYIGQYALVLFFHKIFFLPLSLVDKILVPLLASIILPVSFYFWAKKITPSNSPYFRFTEAGGERTPSSAQGGSASGGNSPYSPTNRGTGGEKVGVLTALCAALLPFSAFIATTPQALANLFLLIVIFLTIINICHSDPDEKSGEESHAILEKYEIPRLPPTLSRGPFGITFLVLIIISIATFLIHPLSGIPAFLFLALILIFEKLGGWKKYLTSFFALILWSIIVPLIFIIRDKSSFQISIDNILPTFRLFVENKFDLFKNFAYLYKFNFWLIFIGLAIIGVALLPPSLSKLWRTGVARNKRAISCAVPLILTSLAVFLNAVFLKIFIKFPEVISYEQADYSNRLIGISALFLYPLALVPAIYFFKKVIAENFLVKFFAVVFITYLVVSSFYISYPRVDKFESSHGFSTSKFDIDAVKFIDEKSEGKKYIVLANQATSAAALKEFGFKDRYYKTAGGKELYFYPVPTGSKLYEYYLKMIYGFPSRFTANEAMEQVGAEKLYFVVSSYWHNAKNIVKNAKKTADEWWMIDGGKIYIFKYLRDRFESKYIGLNHYFMP